jgi:competence protein ComEA
LLEVWAFLVLGLAVGAFANGLLGSRSSPELEVKPHCIDVNRAGVDELTVLPGIGRARAEAIVLSRVRHGPFRGLQDLERVEGFGPAMLAGLHGAIRFGSAASPH